MSHDDPLRAHVRIKKGTECDGFQLQPLRPLTAAERGLVVSRGDDPSCFCWVGRIVPTQSAPARWSMELAADIQAAQELLEAAGRLCGELVFDPDHPFGGIVGPSLDWGARHFLALEYSGDQSAAEDRANKVIGRYCPSFPDAQRWLVAGDGRRPSFKYSP